MEDPLRFLEHIEAARPLLSSIEAEPTLLSSSECNFIAKWICTLYPTACTALDEAPAAAAAAQKSGALATLAGANGVPVRVKADKRRKSMLPAPPRKSMPAAAAAAAAAPPAARQQQIVVASDSDASSHSKNHANGHGKTGSNVVSGLRLRALERGESGVGAAAVVAQLRSALTANLGRVSDLFREWDVDSSGTVDKAEFHKALMRLGLNSTKAESAAIFDSLDEDASGALEFRELHKKLRCLPHFGTRRRAACARGPAGGRQHARGAGH